MTPMEGIQTTDTGTTSGQLALTLQPADQPLLHPNSFVLNCKQFINAINSLFYKNHVFELQKMPFYFVKLSLFKHITLKKKIPPLDPSTLCVCLNLLIFQNSSKISTNISVWFIF